MNKSKLILGSIAIASIIGAGALAAIDNSNPVTVTPDASPAAIVSTPTPTPEATPAQAPAPTAAPTTDPVQAELNNHAERITVLEDKQAQDTQPAAVAATPAPTPAPTQAPLPTCVPKASPYVCVSN